MRSDSVQAWYARTVFLVRDVNRALAYYIDNLGFSEQWLHEDEGQLIAAQVNRDGLEIILNRDHDRAGKGRVFMSLARGQVRTVMDDFSSRGAEVFEGHWGMPIMFVRDCDGNELYFHDDELAEE
jgi:catechol 2,3-dioxygenase-like lactoylglutathione lyase family enzyme